MPRSFRHAASKKRSVRRRAAPTRGRTHRFEMTSQRAAVAPTVDRVLAVVGPAGLTPGQEDDLAVALAEALSNAAIHGNHLRPEARVIVTVRVKPRAGVAIDVEDSGAGFDAAGLSDPTDPSRVLSPGGRGVFLMGRLVDNVEYNAAGNRVRLTVKRRRGKAGRR